MNKLEVEHSLPTIHEMKEDDEGDKNIEMDMSHGSVSGHINREETASKSNNSLLDGVYDPDESRNSFLEALNTWRCSVQPDNDTKECMLNSSNTQTPKAATNIKIQFQPTLSYFDKILKCKMKTINNEEIQLSALNLKQQEKSSIEDSLDEENEWTTEDEQNLKFILENQYGKDSKINKETCNLQIQIKDVTDTVDDYLKSCFDEDRIIEFIPYSKLKIIEIE